MSFTIGKNTKTGAKPLITQQLLGISDNRLILQDGFTSSSIMTGWGGAWIFWLVGLPMFLLAAIAPWLPPYGYNEDNSIATLSDVIQNIDVQFFFVYIFLFLGFGSLGCLMGLGIMHLYTRLAKGFSPVTFDREKQTYSIFEEGELLETPWKNVSGGGHVHRQISGTVMSTLEVLLIRTSGKRKIAIEVTPTANMLEGDDGEYHDSIEGTWEYIRHFMEYGPDELNVPPMKFLGLKHLDKQPMYSYDFKQSLKSCSVLTVFSNKSRHPADIFFGLIKWAIKVVFFIPNVLADWLWHKKCLKHFKDNKGTPQYSFDLCGSEKIIKPTDAERVITAEEASADITLSYSEVKRRLEMNMTD